MTLAIEALKRTAVQPIRVVPMDGCLGAEIEGLDVSRPLNPGEIATIRQALIDHQLVVLRNQTLTPAQQLAFAEQFGEIETYPFAEHIPGHPGVVAVTKEPSTELNFGGVWHTDSPYLEQPPGLTVLYGVDIPPEGGDTMFASMYAAYDALSDGMKALLDRKNGVFSACCVQMNDELKLGDVVRRRDPERAMAANLHPIVRTHPQSGRKAIYVSRVHVQCLEGLTEAESAPILDYLAESAIQPRFTTRLKWRKGTVVMWDNRCVLHRALNDYPGHRREVHRIILKGERPA